MDLIDDDETYVGEYKPEFLYIESIDDIVVCIGVDVLAGLEYLDLGAGYKAFDGVLELVDEDDSMGDDEGLEADLGGEVDGEGGLSGSGVEGEDDGTRGVEGGDDLGFDLVLDITEGTCEGEVDGFAVFAGFAGWVDVLDGVGKGEDEVVLSVFKCDDGFLACGSEAHELGFSGGGLDGEVFRDGVDDILGDIRFVNDKAHLL